MIIDQGRNNADNLLTALQIADVEIIIISWDIVKYTDIAKLNNIQYFAAIETFGDLFNSDMIFSLLLNH